MKKKLFSIFILIFILQFISAEYGYCNPNLPGGQNCNPLLATSTTFNNNTTTIITNGTNLFTSINQTQFNNSTGVLNIVVSWLNGLINLTNYIPYTNASSNINLGNKNLTVNGTSIFNTVGIGITAPADVLHVSSNKGTNYLHVSDIRSTTGDSVGIMFGTGVDPLYGKSLIAHQETGTDPFNGRGDLLFCVDSNNDASSVNLTADEKMRITSGGNVGIGTTTPSRQLSLGGNPNPRMSLRSNSSTGDGAIVFGDVASDALGYLYYNHNGDYMAFYTNASEKMRIQADGDVGIGTTTPTAKFDVSYGGITSIFGADLNTNTRTNATPKYSRLGSPHYLNYEEPVAFLTSANINGDNYLYVGGGTSVMNAPTIITFYTGINSTTTTGTERMRITSGGDVGIGTTTPSYPLHVNTNISGISIYSRANVSASGYITRTEVYDKSKGSALNQIKDSSIYFTNGKINHSAFGYSYVSYDKTVVDKEIIKPITKEVCEPQEDICYNEVCTKQEDKCHTESYNETTITYKTIQEEGMSLDRELALLKQAVYELKVENERIKNCANAVDYKSYRECVL